MFHRIKIHSRMNSRKEKIKTRISNHLQEIQTQMKHRSEIINLTVGKPKKFHPMKLKTDKPVKIQRVT